MPDFRFVCAKSELQPTSGYALRISQAAWSQHESLIRRLHECGNTRDEILQVLVNEWRFEPSVGQLRDQMARWGLRSSRKSRTKTTTKSEDISSSSGSGSDGVHGTPSSHSLSFTLPVYNNIPDQSFASTWMRYEMGVLSLRRAFEIEALANMLFLGGRYVAAFNLYSSIYNSPVAGHRSDQNFHAVRFRALFGCLKSSGNAEQRYQIVVAAEAELQRCFGNNFCNLDEIDLSSGTALTRSALMTRFTQRENFRYGVAGAVLDNPVREMILGMQVDDSRGAALLWCFNRLNTVQFVSFYNNHLHRSGSGIASWTYGGSQAIIYWYLVVSTTDESAGDPPCFRMSNPLGHTYLFSYFESLALAASIISSEPWLFSLDNLPLDGIRHWGDSLLCNESLFDTLFQEAVKSTLIPRFTLRMNKTNSDALAFQNGYPAYSMPAVEDLNQVASKIGCLDDQTSSAELDGNPIDNNPSLVWNHATFDALIREYSVMMQSYIEENCAFGNSYEIRPRPTTFVNNTNVSISSVPPTSTSSPFLQPLTRVQLDNIRDPPLVPSAGVSTRSNSYQSFQSTHRRTMRPLARVPDFNPVSREPSVASSRVGHLSLAVGAR